MKPGSALEGFGASPIDVVIQGDAINGVKEESAYSRPEVPLNCSLNQVGEHLKNGDVANEEFTENQVDVETIGVPTVTVRLSSAVTAMASQSLEPKVPLSELPLDASLEQATFSSCDVTELSKDGEKIEDTETAGVPKLTSRRITAMKIQASQALEVEVANPLTKVSFNVRLPEESLSDHLSKVGDPVLSGDALVSAAIDSFQGGSDSKIDMPAVKLFPGVGDSTGSREDKGEFAEGEVDSEVEEGSQSQGCSSLEDSDEEDVEDSSYSPSEVPLNDEEVDELVDELFRIESEAAEAQEWLEEESRLCKKDEIKKELGETLSGSELDARVEEEFNDWVERWEQTCEEKQDQSSLLQERLEDAGVSLPHIFKEIEKQTPAVCVTEAWKARTHWAGHQPSEETVSVVKHAELELKIRNPTRSVRGKLVDEGASGFLKKKLAVEAEDDDAAGALKLDSLTDSGWWKVDDVLDNEENPEPGKLMGTKRWAAVYLASTPEQAVQLGLALPGADTVEEIGDTESERRSHFKAAIANEKERGLTEQQKHSIKKVKEEDDVKRSRGSRKRQTRRISQLPRVTKPRQESKVRSKALGETEQPEKTEKLSLVASEGVESRELLCKQTTDEGAEVIDLISDDEGTFVKLAGNTLEYKRTTNATEEIESSAAKLVGSLLNVSVVGKLEATMTDKTCEHVKHGDFPSLLVQTCVDLKEYHGKLGIPVTRSDVPEALTVIPRVPQLRPVLELDSLKRKRPEEEILTSDADTQVSPKKLKYLSVTDNGGQKDVKGSSVEQLLPCSVGLSDDAKQSGLLDTTTLYRTTVVIDSDGEREVQEAVMESSSFTSTVAESNHFENITHTGLEGLVNVTGRTVVDRHSKLAKANSLTRRGNFVSRASNAAASESEAFGDSRKRKWKSTPEKERRDFPCTACGTLLRKKEVLRHPRLPVGICKKCEKHYLSGPFRKDEDGSDSECSWCGEGGQVVCCGQCDKVFCQACIIRNFGVGENLRIVTSDDWLCYFCNGVPLSIFSRQLRQAEVEVEATCYRNSGAGSGVQNTVATVGQKAAVIKSNKGRHRKNIRRVLDDDELEEQHKDLLMREEERQRRLEEWRAGSKSALTMNHHSKNIVSGTNFEGATDKHVINVPRAENEDEVKIALSIARVLKPHQLQGVRFMWENCIVSEQGARENAGDFGCILAHTMGLGKTLQVITFIHTVLNRNLGLRTALVVVPVNVLHNWKREFEIWQAEVTNPVSVYLLDDYIRDNGQRASFLQRWQEAGGVMLIGYSAFRILSLGKHVRDKLMRDAFCCALQNPGPDLLVCDEAHTIKNRKADITQVLKQVKTRRRIALTGTPLQNNLMEYYCMVDFVREGFLGTSQAFKNRFQNPIENGQHADSTARDVRLMKERAHVLFKRLNGFVQRMNTSVLKDDVPPKCVYVISVRLSPLQRKLYAHYLQVHGLLQDEDEVMESKSQRKFLLPAYHALAKVWNHPDLLLRAEERTRKQEDTLDDCNIDSEEEKLSEGDIGSGDCSSKGKTKGSSSHRSLKKKGSTELDELEKPLWWKGIITEDFVREQVEVSGKMVLLLRLLTMSARNEDKALVFSQSLSTLGLIERFLERVREADGAYWHQDKHWYRLDGSTPGAERMQMCERFNDPSNTSVKCVLISTRAGSLGINLTAANRVIIVDGSWNPSHDLQALFRAWRLGQKKPVYAYRLLAHGTMEEKIYSRQVAKEGVAARVLDEHQVGRHFDGNDLEFLFRLEDDGDDFVFESEKSQHSLAETPLDQGTIGPAQASRALVSLGSTSRSKLLAFTLPADAPPRDDLMGNLLIDYRPTWVVSYHEHEPLLEHREEENLTDEEQAAAWESYHSIHRTVDSVIQNPAGGFVQCHTKDHAAMLSARSVPVGGETSCPVCQLSISWENFGGLKHQAGPQP